MTYILISSILPVSSHIELCTTFNLLQAVDLDDDQRLKDSDPITVAVCAEKSLTALKAFCSRYHDLGVKQVGCNVKGVCGFVCDDFLNGFNVVDSDGELSREVRIKQEHVT